jgi:hypothetical protein
MHWRMIGLAFAFGGTGAAAQAPAASDAAAERLFVAAQFDSAARLFLVRYGSDSTDYAAALRLGQIALFHNRFPAAERWLTRAIALRPDEAPPKVLLAEAYARRDRFGDALPLVRAAGRTQRAVKLAGFAGRTPHRLAGVADSTIVPFVRTDPLPLVVGSVNGSDTLFLLIDTGGGELTLDSVVAERVGAERFGTAPGQFAGGQAPVTDGRVDSVRLGAFTLHDVPIRIINTRQFATCDESRPRSRSPSSWAPRVPTRKPTSSCPSRDRGLERSARSWLARGFAHDGDLRTGVLLPRERDTLSISLDTTRQYLLLATCDEDCGDLDLFVIAPDGRRITADVAHRTTAAVLVKPEVAGVYGFEVVMVRCTVEPCYFAAQLLSKAVPAAPPEAPPSGLPGAGASGAPRGVRLPQGL